MSIYTDGSYVALHPTWHSQDAPAKAKVIAPLFDHLPHPLRNLTVVDVGTGTGDVPRELVRIFEPDTPLFIGLEPSPDALAFSDEDGSDVLVRGRCLAPDEVCNVVMYVDVLEHLENPWEELRLAATSRADHLIVHQPLLDNVGLFRHNRYAAERVVEGHLSHFNIRSFRDMAMATGWKLHKEASRVIAPWEMGIPAGRWAPVKRLLTRRYREAASFLLEGFYFTGLFTRMER